MLAIVSCRASLLSDVRATLQHTAVCCARRAHKRQRSYLSDQTRTLLPTAFTSLIQLRHGTQQAAMPMFHLIGRALSSEATALTNTPHCAHAPQPPLCRLAPIATCRSLHWLFCSAMPVQHYTIVTVTLHVQCADKLMHSPLVSALYTLHFARPAPACRRRSGLSQLVSAAATSSNVTFCR